MVTHVFIAFIFLFSLNFRNYKGIEALSIVQEPFSKGCKCQPCTGPPGPPGKDGRDGRDSTVTASLILELVKKVNTLEATIENIEKTLANAGQPSGLSVLDENGHIPVNAIPPTLDGLPSRVEQVEKKLAQSGKPNGFVVLDSNGDIPVTTLPSGYDKVSAYDLSWQSLHIAAAAACRGSTPTGGSGPWHNEVLLHNNADRKTCKQVCASSPNHKNCDGEVSIQGNPGKGTYNGQTLGRFYNYGCDGFGNSGSEASDVNESILKTNRNYLSFCCCRK